MVNNKIIYEHDPSWADKIKHPSRNWKLTDSQSFPWVTYALDWPKAGDKFPLYGHTTQLAAEQAAENIEQVANSSGPPGLNRTLTRDEFKEFIIWYKSQGQTNYSHCSKCKFEYPYGGSRICKSCELWASIT